MVTVLFACTKSPAPEANVAPTEPAAVAVEPTGALTPQEAMTRSLSIKDPAPTCASVKALSQDPVEDLLRVTNEVSHPPWVAMRAATCLLTEHASQVERNITTWLSNEQTKGLGLLALNHLDDMEPALALRLAQTALEGPYPDQARTRISRVKDPTIQALVEE